MKAPLVRRWKKLVSVHALRVATATPLFCVLSLPFVARSSDVARIPALEPIGKEAGQRASAAIGLAFRHLTP